MTSPQKMAHHNLADVDLRRANGHAFLDVAKLGLKHEGKCCLDLRHHASGRWAEQIRQGAGQTGIERCIMSANIVTSDPEILGGTPVFAGTRVPVAVLFENLADGLTLDEILDSYPTLTRDKALAALQQAESLLELKKAA